MQPSHTQNSSWKIGDLNISTVHLFLAKNFKLNSLADFDHFKKIRFIFSAVKCKLKDHSMYYKSQIINMINFVIWPKIKK